LYRGTTTERSSGLENDGDASGRAAARGGAPVKLVEAADSAMAALQGARDATVLKAVAGPDPSVCSQAA
jgi:hypothetical protein